MAHGMSSLLPTSVNIWCSLIGAERPSTRGGTSQKLGRNDRVWGGRGADRLWGGSTVSHKVGHGVPHRVRWWIVSCLAGTGLVHAGRGRAAIRGAGLPTIDQPHTLPSGEGQRKSSVLPHLVAKGGGHFSQFIDMKSSSIDGPSPRHKGLRKSPGTQPSVLRHKALRVV